jgi:hypothetical protein
MSILIPAIELCTRWLRYAYVTLIVCRHISEKLSEHITSLVRMVRVLRVFR